MKLEDRIVYRFTREEVSALLNVMGLAELPGLGIRAATPREEASMSLVEAGIVMLCGERTFVDRTVSAIFGEAARSLQSLSVHAENRAAALYRGEMMYVDVAVEGERVSIEPLPELQSAKSGLIQALWGAQELEMELRDGDRQSRRRGDMRALEALMGEL